MVDNAKGKKYYELTREKPYGLFHMILVGGTACSVLAFLIVSLVGAYEGMPMDSIILAFLTAVLLGFLFGGSITWLAVHYLGPVIDKNEPNNGTNSAQVSVSEVESSEVSPEITEPVEEKGQTIDFVFPEISPDQQG